MGACAQGKAPISYLLRPPPPPSAPPSRRLFLFALPICSCTTLALTIACNGNAKASTGLRENPFTGLAESYDPGSTVSQTQKEASGRTSRRVSEALDLLEKGREFQALGNFNEALLYFTKVVESYKDFAFSEYARVGRALALYEVGDREEAIAEMEDVSISLNGYPEVHAALAAALYVDKHAPLLAENQFAIATLLDPHYTDLSYVKEIKHWPPSLVCSLQHFITLS